MKTNLRARLPTASAILFGLGLLLGGGNAMAADGAWKLDSPGNWSLAAGWVGNTIADGAGSTAWFTNNISIGRGIQIDGAVSSRTNGVVNLGDSDGSGAFTITASGASLYLSNTAGNAQINELATSRGDIITAPLVLLNSLDVNNASAKTLTLGGGITAGSAGTKTISSLGSGTGTNLISAIIGDGAGTVALVQNSATTSLRLSGANTFSGGVTIKAGTVYLLTLSSAGGGSGLGTITLGNTSGSADATLLGDTRTYNNTVVVQTGSSGVLTMGNSGSSSTVFGGPVTLNTNLTLNAAGAGSINLSSNVTGIGAITATGTGSVTLGGSNDFSGGVILVAGGTLKINAANALGTGRLTLGSGTTIDNTKGSAVVNAGNNLQTWNGDFTFTGGNNLNLGTGAVTLGTNVQLTASTSILTVGGTIGDGGNGYGLTKAGAGKLLLGGSNTYTGATIINGGNILMSGTNATSAVAVNSGATLTFLTDNPFSAGTMLTASNATLTSSNSHSFSSPVTFTGTTNTHSGTGNLTFNGVVTMATSMVFMASGANTVDGFAFASNVVQTLPGSSLTLGGTRSLLLLGSNSYSGGTYVSSTARLIIGNNKALGTGTLYAQAAGGTTTLAWTNSPTVANAIQMQHTNLLSGLGITGNKIVFNGPVTMTTNVVLNLSSAISANDDASAPVFAGGFNDNGNNFSLTVLGSNDRFLIFSNASSYGGGTFILNGLLKLGGHNALPTAGALAVNGPQDLKNGFSLSNFNQTVGSLSGTGVVQLVSGTLTVGDATSSTFSGFMNGTGFLVKQGSGTFTLGGSNAYTGGTIVSNGTLRLGVQTAILSNRAVSVAGGTYDLGGFAAVTNGTMTLSSGAISNGTLLSSSNLLATDSGTIFANLAGNGGLIKTGAGTLSLNGNSSQAGATQVSNGVLRVNGVLSGTAGLAVASNATLGGTGSVRGVTIANGGWLAPGNSIGTLTVSNLTLNSGSLLNFELAATNASDQVIDLGTLTLTQMPFSNFAFTTNAGFGVGTYTLIDAALLSGSFNPVTNESFYGYLGTISLDGANHDLILNVALAIPEPSAFLALGGGATLLVFLRRRKV